MRGLAATVLCISALAFTPAAAAQRTLLLGVAGNAPHFASVTGRAVPVHHIYLGWDQGRTWGASLDRIFSTLSPAPLVTITTYHWPSKREALTPLQIAHGAGDAYLIAFNAAIAHSERHVFYVRPLGEMTGWWNPWCAYTQSGRAKGPGHSTAAFRKAFARMYLLLHGGTAADLNAKLARLGLPGVHQDLPLNPYPALRVIWGAQAHGDPQVWGNRPAAYYPGDSYVDVVGDDPYDLGSVDWNAIERFYRAHPGKGFAFPEWGLKGIDDVAFVTHMASFVRTHRRVELLTFYNGGAGSIYDIASKPRVRAAYRNLILPLAG
jgi:hypothetical protein